jgi:hypothetical protein
MTTQTTSTILLNKVARDHLVGLSRKLNAVASDKGINVKDLQSSIAHLLVDVPRLDREART